MQEKYAKLFLFLFFYIVTFCIIFLALPISALVILFPISGLIYVAFLYWKGKNQEALIYLLLTAGMVFLIAQGITGLQQMEVLVIGEDMLIQLAFYAAAARPRSTVAA